jgi:SAM-dependent methyltransferase
VTSTDYYDRHGEDLAARYDGLEAARLNAAWAPLLDQCRPGLACDIGAGSGRDARWLAGMGWEVVAVEPSAAMRESGARRSTGAAIIWLDDTLPDLRRLRDIGYRFDLILLAAVWQHVPPPQRQRAVRILSELLRPGGRLVITLRHGRNAAENRERGFHAVSAQELGAQARERALVELLRVTEPDLARDDLDWETVVYELPDDGTGSLALLRHVIVNDDKSSSYKLALLRVLARIAETLPGAVITATDDWVEIPLGLVALLWLKQYRPLLKTHSYAVGASGGVGFANDDFHALLEWPDFDLHIGAGLTGQRAKVLTGALRACCKTIKDMPTRYITWPGQNRQVFDAFRAPVRRDVAFKAVDAHYLAGFGRFRIPAAIWRSLGDYACWIEPVIIREWSALPGRWRVADYRQVPMEVFEWEAQRRFTGIAHDRIDSLRKDRVPVRCAWSAKTSPRLEVDHCFPWARWQNNDLWNLLPATPEINRAKSDRLPSAMALSAAEPRILEWWQRAYLDSPLAGRFLTEVSLALPGASAAGDPDALPTIHRAMQHQRARLKTNQQLLDWSPAELG